ncbi:unnamed protein product [Microthlaspi erraticum]|uniref:GTP-eEF1A C-terminal domain-containing protein n=1 Tax=Microthlaspi erraticum TaxID=1685480 RepID=A0A6D2KT94_9BRAS|nr:unnamed protein product [Microthlaspi erraticum]
MEWFCGRTITFIANGERIAATSDDDGANGKRLKSLDNDASPFLFFFLNFTHPIVTCHMAKCLFKHGHVDHANCEIGDLKAYSEEGEPALTRSCFSGVFIERRSPFVKGGESAICKIEVSEPISLERLCDCPRLGRVVLSYAGKTIALGTVVQLDGEMHVGDIPFNE